MQLEDKDGMGKAFAWMKQERSLAGEDAEVITADVVIIGAGHAGTCAARAASEVEGTRVVVIEQQSREKQFILGVGEIGHINSRWQKGQGIDPVDVDEFVNDWQMRTNNRSDYRLIRTYAENSGDCFDWFIEPLSDEEKRQIYPRLAKPSPHMPHTLNGIHAYAGTAMMGARLQNLAVKKNQEIAEKNGAVFLFETKAEELLKDSRRVTGVIARDAKGKLIRIEAGKGVILAAGDYSKNRQMCIDLLTEAADLLDNDTDWLGHGWDGSGIRMGVWAGGRLEPRSHAAMGGNYSLPGFEIIGSAAVLRVNKYGERYNELCRQKRDTDFGKDAALLHEIRKAPFYAVGQMKDSHHPIGQSFKLLVTVSGLLINERQQVLDDEYEPIPGLFATGNCSGCRFGLQYTTSMPGQSISIAQTLGREAGRYVALSEGMV